MLYRLGFLLGLSHFGYWLLKTIKFALLLFSLFGKLILVTHSRTGNFGESLMYIYNLYAVKNEKSTSCSYWFNCTFYILRSWHNNIVLRICFSNTFLMTSHPWIICPLSDYTNLFDDFPSPMILFLRHHLRHLFHVHISVKCSNLLSRSRRRDLMSH